MSTIELGPKSFTLKKNGIYSINVSEKATLTLTNVETGEVDIMYLYPDKSKRIKAYDDLMIDLDISSVAHWEHNDRFDVLHEKGDPVPVEVLEDHGSPLTLEEKLMRAFGERLMAQYGAGSQEVETMENAMDFDIDGDGDIANPYGIPVVEMAPVEPVSPPAEQPAEPAGGEATPEVPTEPAPA